MVHSEDSALSSDELAVFDREGYLIFEGFLEPSLCRELMAEIDEYKERGGMLVAYPTLGGMTSHPPLMAKLEALMNDGFAMHHIHATRFDAGAPARTWHQDYRQIPQSNRSHRMVHSLFYVSGLNGEVGDLLLLPRSQSSIVERDALAILGTADLPGSIAVDSLAPGSLVLMSSALWHARRAKPGGQGQSRYFVDVSYCERGVLWPGHEHGGGWREINRVALEKGLDRGGRYGFVYDSEQFFSTRDAEARLKDFQGSLLVELDGLSR